MNNYNIKNVKFNKGQLYTFKFHVLINIFNLSFSCMWYLIVIFVDYIRCYCSQSEIGYNQWIWRSIVNDCVHLVEVFIKRQKLWLKHLLKKLTLLTCISFWFTGSGEKKAYLQERFPQLTAESFANSRDASFEQHVMLQTQGKGE